MKHRRLSTQKERKMDEKNKINQPILKLHDTLIFGSSDGWLSKSELETL